MKWRPLQDRYWEKVDLRGADDCWEWTAAKDTSGYGNLKNKGGSPIASRIGWQFAYGPIPSGKQVLHRCDNRGCQNPRHLFLGTNADNVADKVKKGRAGSKLTPDRALAIRQSSGTLDSIAKRFGVSFSMVGMIKRRDAWSHV